MKGPVAVAEQQPNAFAGGNGEIELVVTVEVGDREPDLQFRIDCKRLLLHEGKAAVAVAAEDDDDGVRVARRRNVETAVVIEVRNGHVVTEAWHGDGGATREGAVTQTV